MNSFEQISFQYHNRKTIAIRKHEAGVKVVGYTSNAVPHELIRSAGLFPVLISPVQTEFKYANEFMEPVFSQRTRAIFDSILAGEWNFLELIIIPRASEQEHKLFLYLMEIVRIGQFPNIPPIYFFDLLNSQSTASENYGRRQTILLKEKLETVSGRLITSKHLEKEIEHNNHVVKSIQQLQLLRRMEKPKLSGVEAMTVTGAFYFSDHSDYLNTLNLFIHDCETRTLATSRPRILINGYPTDHTLLHEHVERLGGIIVAEDDWWGARCGGPEISTGGDPLENIFQMYYNGTIGPRQHSVSTQSWFTKEVLANIDRVIFYLPPDDDIYGWQYPELVAYLKETKIPSLLIRQDARMFSAEMLSEIKEFLSLQTNC